MALRRNAFPGKCHGCKTRVAEQKGFLDKINGSWVVWCPDCSPERRVSTVRRLTAEGVILWPFDRGELDLIRAFPGARFVGKDNRNWSPPTPGWSEGYWTCSLMPGDRPRVLELADRLKLDVAPELRELKQSQRAELAADSGLYPFQVEGVDFLFKMNRAILGDDMGLGKTIQSLMGLPQDERCLAIVPAVVKQNWHDECLKWRPDLKPVVIYGKKNFRLPDPGELVIVNYELLPKWLEGKKEKNSKKVEYTHFTQEQKDILASTNVVVDETHKVKNYKTQRAKRVQGLAKHCKKVWGLTGTPLLNRPLDLWGMLCSLNMQWQVFKSFDHFVDCFNGFRGRFGLEFGSTCKPIVPELLRRVMLRRLRAEVLPDLPQKTYSTIVVDIQGKGLVKKLDKLMDQYGGCFDDVEPHEGYVPKKGSLPPFEAFSEIRADLAENRIPAVIEYVEDCEEQDVPLVVFSAHVGPVKALGDREGWEYISGETPANRRSELVKRFQAGELKGLACTIIAAGVGLTLTRSWKALFVDLDWTPANNWQAEDRICRIGQESDKCEIVRMVSDHILEKHVHYLLASKISLIQAAIEKEIAVDPQAMEEDGETEEEFQARMVRVQELQEEQAAKSEAELAAEVAAYDEWLEAENDFEDPDIPF